MRKRRFTLTADHVTLLRAMSVWWQGDECGAPGVDPKRPYGGDDFVGDMVGLVAGPEAKAKRQDMVENDEDTSAIDARYFALHRETETALQVVLATGIFEPGTYEADEYKRNWRRVP